VLVVLASVLVVVATVVLVVLAVVLVVVGTEVLVVVASVLVVVATVVLVVVARVLVVVGTLVLVDVVGTAVELVVELVVDVVGPMSVVVVTVVDVVLVEIVLVDVVLVDVVLVVENTGTPQGGSEATCVCVAGGATIAPARSGGIVGSRNWIRLVPPGDAAVRCPRTMTLPLPWTMVSLPGPAVPSVPAATTVTSHAWTFTTPPIPAAVPIAWTLPETTAGPATTVPPGAATSVERRT